MSEYTYNVDTLLADKLAITREPDGVRLKAKMSKQDAEYLPFEARAYSPVAALRFISKFVARALSDLTTPDDEMDDRMVRGLLPDRDSDAGKEELDELLEEFEAHCKAYQQAEAEAEEEDRVQREADKRCKVARTLGNWAAVEWEVRSACIYEGFDSIETLKVMREVIEEGWSLFGVIEKFRDRRRRGGVELERGGPER